MCNDHVGLQGDQLFREYLRPFRAGLRKAIVDADIAALRPSKPFEPLPERREARLAFRIVLGEGQQHADAPHPIGLLRPRRPRPRRRRAAEEGDELASLHERFHSITSSTAICSASGTARPSAFAVFMLITNSKRVGSMTGRSAGFSALRMRPV